MGRCQHSGTSELRKSAPHSRGVMVISHLFPQPVPSCGTTEHSLLGLPATEHPQSKQTTQACLLQMTPNSERKSVRRLPKRIPVLNNQAYQHKCKQKPLLLKTEQTKTIKVGEGSLGEAQRLQALAAGSPRPTWFQAICHSVLAFEDTRDSRSAHTLHTCRQSTRTTNRKKKKIKQKEQSCT